MKHLLIIFSLLLTSVSWSKDIDFNDLIERENTFFEKFSDEPFNGHVVGKIQGQIKKGKQHGNWKKFDDAGRLWREESYKNGLKHGTFKWWNSKGFNWKVVNYKNGRLHGKELQYKNDTQQLIMSTEYKNGLRHGDRKHWNSGILVYHVIFKNGIEEKVIVLRD